MSNSVIASSIIAVVRASDPRWPLADSMAVTREILWNIPEWLTAMFYLLVAVGCGWTVIQFIRRFRQQHRSRGLTESVSTPLNRSLANKTVAIVTYLTFHQQLRRDRFAGTAHLLIFYGFFILFVGTCLVFLEHDTPLHFFYGTFYLVASLIIDLGGVAFLIGLAMFLHRRMIGTSARILDRFYVSALLWLLLVIGITGFLLEGARIAVDLPEFERWSVVGYAIAYLLNGLNIQGDAAGQLHRWLWGFHAAVCVAFFALLPWRFFSHLVYSPLSWAIKTDRPIAVLRSVDLSGAESTLAPGATQWNQFNSLDLLHADACTTCGRCNEVCPANAVGKPLRPRDVVLGIRESMNRAELNLSELIVDDAIWSCTTCGACNQACPVGIEVYDKIVDLRRGKVESDQLPARASERFQSLTDHANPFQRDEESRLNWAAGMQVPVAQEGEQIELLYWVGCAGSFDPDGQSVTRSMIKILNHLSVPYRILGRRERCTGDPARRLGEEGLFQEMALANIHTLEAHGVKHVLTHCPHCFNVFKNEYPQLRSMQWKVEHHSQFLARMLEEGNLTLASQLNAKVTFHDPCYLGRGNGDTHSPRAILAKLPKTELVEMPRHGAESFCCGAGGGSIWLDVAGKQRIENVRCAEAASTGASMVVTGCPFCRSMLEAGRQSLHNDSQLSETVDLAELIVRAMGM